MEKLKNLSGIIIDRIKKEGPISFRDYMDMCLYYPELGYYKQAKEKIGVNGDFFTSSYLTPCFGATIGRQIEEMWQILNHRSFTILEYGAGSGLLCSDILAYIKEIPEMYEHIHYAVIEAGPQLRALENSPYKERVKRYERIEDIEGDIQCILSNEFMDNLPVHQVETVDGQLMEIYIDFDGQRFFEIFRPANTELVTYFDQLGIKLPENFRTEVSIDAKRWIEKINTKLAEGFIITIDYGGLSEEIYKPYRSSGTLLCYKSHRICDDLFNDIGDQDITAHVNFSALIHWGKMNGIEMSGITAQYLFLLSLGFQDHLTQFYEQQKNGDIVQLIMEKAHITRTLLLEMGEKFKVLIQSKNVCGQQLKGLSLSNQLQIMASGL